MRFRVPLWVLIGVGLMLMGLGGRAAVDHWMSTRTVYPIDMAVSLAQGHIRTGPFRLNLDANYLVYLNPGTDWQWESTHPECNPYQHLQTRWTLYEKGKVVARLDEPTALFGLSEFRASPGVYELDVEVMSDFSCLDSIPPHLRVVADIVNYEMAALFARGGLAIGAYIGFVLLTFVPIIRLIHSLEFSEKITGLASVGQDFRWARKLPLRKPISGLPGFGLVAGTFYALIAIVMMVTTAASRVYTARFVGTPP